MYRLSVEEDKNIFILDFADDLNIGEIKSALSDLLKLTRKDRSNTVLIINVLKLNLITESSLELLKDEMTVLSNYLIKRLIIVAKNSIGPRLFERFIKNRNVSYNILTVRTTKNAIDLANISSKLPPVLLNTPSLN